MTCAVCDKGCKRSIEVRLDDGTIDVCKRCYKGPTADEMRLFANRLMVRMVAGPMGEVASMEHDFAMAILVLRQLATDHDAL